MSIKPPRIYGCREWGAIPVNISFPVSRAVGCVVHHTTSPNRASMEGDREVAAAFKLARDIQHDHLSRYWADTGNHFTITRGGIIVEGRHGSLAGAVRGMVPQGAHAGDNDANKTWWGIEWEGRYDQQYLVTPEQWKAAVDLYAWLAFWGDFDTQNIEPHCHFKATTCPGLLKDHIEQLRQQVHDRKVAIENSKR